MDARAAARQALSTVLSATPVPDNEREPTDLLGMAETLMEIRKTALDSLRRLTDGDGDLIRRDPELSALVREIGERDAQWAAALERARRTVGDRLHASQRLRRARATY